MPKYKEIADEIREKILNHEYETGQKLPYEYKLCVTYHCNKETMKKALNILVAEGLIIRRRGSGTFVKDVEPDTALSSMTNYSLTYRFKDSEVTSDIIEFEVIPCDSFLASKLKIEEGDFIYHIIRNRYVDNKPYLVDISYIPLSIVPNLKVDVLKSSLYKHLRHQLKLHVQSCHITISSAQSTYLEQDFLGLLPGEPYIQEEHISYLTSGQVFEYTISRMHYKNYQFHTITIN